MEANRAQKRAISLNQDLSNLNVDHLLTFIDGIEPTEPPTYQLVGGVIQPPLAKVTLKESASSYDFGNVVYGNGARHVRVRVENGIIKVVKDKNLLEDDGNVKSHRIQRFVAKEALELFKIKYQAIVEHADRINAVRAFAYNLPQQPVRRSINGQAPSQNDDLDGESNSAKPLKRKPGEPIVQHACNKRAKVGLDVSSAAKIDAVSNVPDQVKIDLFDAIAKVAMPNYPISVDNLLVAGWNVVSIFTHVGTESAELAKSIAELKTVLIECEGKSSNKKKAAQDKEAGTPKAEVAPDPESTPAPASQDNTTRKSVAPVMARKETLFDDSHAIQDTQAHVRTHHPHSNSSDGQSSESTPTKQLFPHQRRLGGLEALQMYPDPDSDPRSKSPEEQRRRNVSLSPHQQHHQQHPHQLLHPDLEGLAMGGGPPHESPPAHRQTSALASAVLRSKKNTSRGMGMMPEARMGHNVGREQEREREERERASLDHW